MIENDYELIELAKEGNEETINYIYHKYKPIIIKKSKTAILKLTHHGIEINDIMQEAYIGLQEAIDNFKQTDDSTFYTFANLCIDRKITNYIKKNKTIKGKILNEAIYIDENMENNISNIENAENELVKDDQTDIKIRKINKILTPFEHQVFELKIKGYDIKEIAKSLNITNKSTYNCLHRIKEKIQKIVENDN